MMEGQKIYPKSEVYSHLHKSAFERVEGRNEERKGADTSLNDLSQSNSTWQVNQVLRQRV